MNDFLVFAFGTVVLLGALSFVTQKAPPAEFTGFFVKLLAWSVTSILFLMLYNFCR